MAPAARPTVAAALHASPLSSMFVAHAETRRGIIEAGRDADLVVLDRDLPAGDAAAITGTRVVATVVSGRVVHGEGAA